ncbi:hypothetical protein EVJ50_02345 [Synechococcus sp. RSCCF101]|uniref:hypothetical protein n=1 Tax=Synechococcus sp. RSCCF101 TaxID=2511069 RepID=UPI00124892CD|nr:hypothetical protein [Synechococcus sp. RSCCF101]QEY31257.1 hypothetical protein EVJ50_02345 [Synechococcus sp. RSCCF101]
MPYLAETLAARYGMHRPGHPPKLALVHIDAHRGDGCTTYSVVVARPTPGHARAGFTAPECVFMGSSDELKDFVFSLGRSRQATRAA